MKAYSEYNYHRTVTLALMISSSLIIGLQTNFHWGIAVLNIQLAIQAQLWLIVDHLRIRNNKEY